MSAPTILMSGSGLEMGQELGIGGEALAGGQEDDGQACDAGCAGDHVDDCQLKFYRR